MNWLLKIMTRNFETILSEVSKQMSVHAAGPALSLGPWGHPFLFESIGLKFLFETT